MPQVVVALVANAQGAYLSLERAKEDGVRWSFPSGKRKECESETAAVVRETLEETGVLCRPLRKLGERRVGDNDLQYWECAYVAGLPQAPAPDAVTGLRETFNVAFRRPDELAKLMDPARMFLPVRRLLRLEG